MPRRILVDTSYIDPVDEAAPSQIALVSLLDLAEASNAEKRARRKARRVYLEARGADATPDEGVELARIKATRKAKRKAARREMQEAERAEEKLLAAMTPRERVQALIPPAHTSRGHWRALRVVRHLPHSTYVADILASQRLVGNTTTTTKKGKSS